MAPTSTAVRRLIQQGVDVNRPLADGATALHWAAHSDNVAIADLLIGAGATMDATDDGGITPLSLACYNASPAMVGRLLKAGANPNHGTRETPVMIAAQTGNVEVMKLLLAHGGNANAKEPGRGQTALMWAVAERHPDVAKVLVENGADVRARTVPVKPAGGRGGFGMGGGGNGANGFTPLLFATRAGDLASVTAARRRRRRRQRRGRRRLERGRARDPARPRRSREVPPGKRR